MRGACDGGCLEHGSTGAAWGACREQPWEQPAAPGWRKGVAATGEDLRVRED